jgi:outer membrane protein TolC
MAKRIVALLVFVWMLTFCATPQVVVPPMQSARATPAPAAPPPIDMRLAGERVEAAQSAFAQTELSHRAGRATVDEVCQWSERLFRAQEEMLAGRALVDAAHDQVERMKKLDEIVQRAVKGGIASPTDALKVKYFVANAEIDLRRAQAL